ncbi:MAG: hypothetical protein U9R15_07215 [Chloroflexota bacterium]|nr:hypothetical protein [Chloroflexota bacterium]
MKKRVLEKLPEARADGVYEEILSYCDVEIKTERVRRLSPTHLVRQSTEVRRTFEIVKMAKCSAKVRADCPNPTQTTF